MKESCNVFEIIVDMSMNKLDVVWTTLCELIYLYDVIHCVCEYMCIIGVYVTTAKYMVESIHKKLTLSCVIKYC